MHRGAIYQNDNGPSVTVCPGSSLSTAHFIRSIVFKVLLGPLTHLKDKYNSYLSSAEDTKRPPKIPSLGDFLGQGKTRPGGRGRGKGRGQGKSYRYAIMLLAVEKDSFNLTAPIWMTVFVAFLHCLLQVMDLCSANCIFML